MGITLEGKKGNLSIDIGCGGFNKLRLKIAELIGGEFVKHYNLLFKPEIHFMDFQTDSFFDKYDEETEALMKKEKISKKVIDFLYQPDCEGSIHYGACKQILKIIGDYDDNILYGYCARSDCAKFSDFKAILQECVDNKCDLLWS